MEGYIYVIKCGDFYKIGYTKSNPLLRLSALQIGSPFKLKLTTVKKVKSPRDLECFLHDYFSDLRHRGEWFCLKERDMGTLETIIDSYYDYDDMLKVLNIKEYYGTEKND